MRIWIFVLCSLFLAPIGTPAQQTVAYGESIEKRFIPPQGYERVESTAGSFARYLREYPLKIYGTPVYLYDGGIKANQVHVSVFRMPLLKKDLIQCADAIIKLRAEYFYANQNFEAIHFMLTNGMRVPFSRFANGERILARGNSAKWTGGGRRGYGREVFDQYLEFIYSYSGTYSLSRELKSVPVSEIQIGDIFIAGGMPGHAVMVIDLARDARTQKTIMLLGQSYMPSQEFHVLKSPDGISPWYHVRDELLATPEWTFEKGSLMRFQ